LPDLNTEGEDKIFTNHYTSVLIDWPRLFLEWLIVAVLTALRVFLWPGGTSQSVPDRPGETGPSRFVPSSGGPEVDASLEEDAEQVRFEGLRFEGQRWQR
jgi:hypothetical protein